MNEPINEGDRYGQFSTKELISLMLLRIKSDLQVAGHEISENDWAELSALFLLRDTNELEVADRLQKGVVEINGQKQLMVTNGLIPFQQNTTVILFGVDPARPDLINLSATKREPNSNVEETINILFTKSGTPQMFIEKIQIGRNQDTIKTRQEINSFPIQEIKRGLFKI
ncbi:MAG: hypothetical protein WCJ19_05970 [bacterium]